MPDDRHVLFDRKYPLSREFPHQNVGSTITLSDYDLSTLQYEKMIPANKEVFDAMPGLLIHRVFRMIYHQGIPIIPKDENDRWIAAQKPLSLLKGWCYFIQLPSETVVRVAVPFAGEVEFSIIRGNEYILGNSVIKREFNKFCRDLEREINRVKDAQFIPKQIKEEPDKAIFSILNLYLSNYEKARWFLHMGVEYETKLSELLVEANTDKEFNVILVKGIFLEAAISHFFMALEGFVNIMYRGQIKRKLIDYEARLQDLELKLVLMPEFLINMDEGKYKISELLKDYRSLKNFRNLIFHSKLKDSMWDLSVIEDGVLWSLNHDYLTSKTGLFPEYLYELTLKHVFEAKRIVDDIIELVFSSHSSSEQSKLKKIFEEWLIPLQKTKSGLYRFGLLDQTEAGE